MTGRRYWAMRTDQARRAFIWRELQAGRMRQGWGIRPDDNLEHLQRIRRAGGRLDDFGRAVWRGNRRLLPTEPGSMQVGDIVVLSHLPRHGVWSIVRVTGGYRYEVSDEPNAWDGRRDYGHIRDVKLLTDERGIDPARENVPEALRKAMRNRQRLWSLDPVAEEVEPFLGGRLRPSSTTVGQTPRVSAGGCSAMAASARGRPPSCNPPRAGAARSTRA